MRTKNFLKNLKNSHALHNFSKIIKRMSLKRLQDEKIQAIYFSEILLFPK